MVRLGNLRIGRSFAAGVCLAVLMGCSGEAPPKTVPVTGSVVYNGQPVVGAQVTFTCEAVNSKPATGITDKDGKFQLSTNAVNDGAVPGEHKITVSKVEGTGTGTGKMDTSALEDPTKMAAQYVQKKDSDELATKLKLQLPEKYASVMSTPLKETVKAEGQNNFVLQLVD